MEVEIPVEPVKSEVVKCPDSEEIVPEDVTECIGDCTAAVDLQKVVNDPAVLRTQPKSVDEQEFKDQTSDNDSPEKSLSTQKIVNKEKENDKCTMTDLLEEESATERELRRIFKDEDALRPPKCPDVPLSESETESEESFAEVDVTSDFNLKNLKLTMQKKLSPKIKDQENFHFCSQCLKIPKEVYKDMAEYAGIEPCEAKKAAFTLMQFLKTPQGTTVMNSILTKEEKCQRTPVLPKIKLTKDEKVCYFLRRLTRQKGCWAAREDDAVILPILANLNVLLDKIDTKLLKAALKRDQYRSVKNLVVYFEMEKRWSIRSEILGCFDLLSTRDDCALSVLLLSDLPVHLALEIQNPHSDSECALLNSDCKCAQKTTLYAGMLTALLRSGDPMPTAHSDFLDVDFVLYLLGKIENYRNERRDHPLGFVYMKLILAMNIQFASSEVFENPVISALSIMPKLTMFKYKLMCYLTNKDDALDAYEFETQPPYAHSALKLLEDMLGCMHTTNVFNIDEIKFIFETLLAHLTDTDCCLRIRTPVLRNIRLLLCKLKYEHPKLKELARIFKRILRESPSSKQDKKCIQEMVNALSVYRLCTDVNTKFTAL